MRVAKALAPNLRRPGLSTFWEDKMMTRGLSVMVALAFVGMASVAARADRSPREAATCKSAYGTTECGYGCLAAYGEVKCAARPGGMCKAAYGEIVCWDEPQRRHHGHERAVQGADCLSAYGKTECGYGCKAAYGEVRCGRRAGATCTAANGEIACGFGCIAAYGELRCASRPGGHCVAAYGEVTCSR